MRHLQPPAHPCNARPITRKETLGQRFEFARRLSLLPIDKANTRNEEALHVSGSLDLQALERCHHPRAGHVISIIEDLIAEGDKVVARWRSRATHQGDYMGIAPTGNEVEFTGISFYRIEGGKIAQSWNIEDQLGLMRQIGAFPKPEQSEEASPT